MDWGAENIASFRSSYARMPVAHWFVQHSYLSCSSLCPQDLACMLRLVYSKEFGYRILEPEESFGPRDKDVAVIPMCIKIKVKRMVENAGSEQKCPPGNNCV